MLLTVDVGNTNIVLGLYAGQELVGDWRMRTDARITADELALTVRGLLRPHADAVTGISALSTVPAVLRELRVMLSRYYANLPKIVVEPGVRTGVPLLVDNPKEVGADRLANTLAAHHLHPTACVVVDFGTSTNVDAISARGEFLGGAFAPGIEISVDALALRGEVERALGALEDVRRIKVQLTNASTGIEEARRILDGMAERVRGHLAQIDALVASADVAE